MGYWLVTELKFVTNQTNYSTGPDWYTSHDVGKNGNNLRYVNGDTCVIVEGNGDMPLQLV